MSTLLKLLVAVASATLVRAHMEMASPPPRRSQRNPFVKESDRDYNLNFPLEPHTEFKFPCRGAPAGPSVATLTPGTSFPVQLLGSAIHDGGHCQFSISYDGGKTFVALHTILNRCMLDGLSFQVPLPATLPGGPAVFAWTWVNKTGNRELYMNCADVTVKGPATGTLKGPKIVVANILGAPVIGEFGAGADARLDLYQNQPLLEVGPGLSSAGQGQAVAPEPTASSSYASAFDQPTPRPANSSPGTAAPTPIPQRKPAPYRIWPIVTASRHIPIPSLVLTRTFFDAAPIPGPSDLAARRGQEPERQRPVPRIEYPVDLPSPVPVALKRPVQRQGAKNKVRKCGRRMPRKAAVAQSLYN